MVPERSGGSDDRRPPSTSSKGKHSAKMSVLGSPTPKSCPDQAGGRKGNQAVSKRTFALLPSPRARDHWMHTQTRGCSPPASTGECRILETIKQLPGLCFLGFIPHSSISTPAANFSTPVPAPSAHLDLLPALLQLLGAQGGLSRRHFAFALP